jgi:predicted transglutaminase-like cysteine proteinase
MSGQKPRLLQGRSSSCRAATLIASVFAGLWAAEANAVPACLDGLRIGLCVGRQTQTDPAPFIIGAFGGEQFPAPEGLLWEKWRKVEVEIEKDAMRMVRCRVRIDCPWPVIEKFSAIVRGAAMRQGFERLNYVNGGINAAITFVEDAEALGVPDLWQSPIATFQAGRGDCEDYAIAKYVALRLAGTPIDDRQLVIVRDIRKRRDHMVVGVRHDGQWLILDSTTTHMSKDSELPQYIPRFAIDDRGLRQYGRPSPPGGFHIHDLMVSACARPVA